MTKSSGIVTKVTMRVQWTNIENIGSIEQDLQRTVGTTVSNAKSPKQTVGLRNFYDRQPLEINGTSNISLPLCGGGQPITLTVPAEKYTGVPTETIVDYVWIIPSTWNPQGGTVLSIPSQPAPTGYVLYLAGRSITVTPPVGEDNRNIVVRFYSRTCNETFTTFNPPYGLVSLPRPLTFLRSPTLSVAGLPTEVRCGDRTGYVPASSSANTGGAEATYSYSVVSGAGWQATYNTKFGQWSVIPSGTNGATIRSTAEYRCVAGGPVVATVTKDVVIGFTSSPIQPTILAAPPLCPGQTRRVFATRVPGASQYAWTVDSPLSYVQSNPADWFINVTAPSSLTTLVTANVSVTAVIPGCSSTTDTKAVQVGYGDARIKDDYADIFQHTTAYRYVCPNNSIRLYLQEDAPVGVSDDFTWTSDWTTPPGGVGSEFTSGQGTAMVQVSTPPVNRNWRVYVRYRDGCGTYHLVTYYAITANGWDGGICQPPVQPRPAIYPNPATNLISLDHMRGPVALYDSHGTPIQQRIDSLSDSPLRINVQHLANGLYYVVGQGANGQVVRQAVQVQH